MASAETATEITSKPDTQNTEPGDHDKLSHYVRKADIVKAQVEGVPVQAVCGKVWLPTRDGERFPVCPDCKAIYEQMRP